MRLLRLVPIILLALLANRAAYALSSATATVKVQCTGDSSAQVAVRWGHPNYDSTDYGPIFKAHCDGTLQATTFTIADQKSQFEVQTKGGIQTAYAVDVDITSGSMELGSIQLTHAGSPDVITRGTGFHIKRSSGPNRYGEQNFRVYLDEPTSVQAQVMAQSSGDRSSAQMALRWGHPDFNDHEYFPLWTIKAGPGAQKMFPLSDDKSQFEIQTEGGEGTAYHLSIWFNQGRGFPMQPSIEISHQLSDAEVATETNGITFDASKGNIYGELDVRVTIPQLPAQESTTPAESGWDGRVQFCNPTQAYATEYLHLVANTTPVPGAQGMTVMTEDNIVLSIPPGSTAVGSVAPFQTKRIYQQGTWTITKAFITAAPSTGAVPRNASMLPNLPMSLALPGSAGTPVLNFTGGSCAQQ